jgi:hypothetical protein
MLYIVGHTFTVKNPINDIPLNRNRTYKIYHIEKDKETDGFAYKFIDAVSHEIKEMKFPNSRLAEKIIARISNSLKEYEDSRRRADDNLSKVPIF